MAGYRDNDYNVGLVMRQSIRERERKKETEIDRLTATGKKTTDVQRQMERKMRMQLVRDVIYIFFLLF